MNQGAIPAEMFNEANTEHIALFAKLRPFLAEVRSATGYPDYLANIERVIGMLPQPEERVALFERYMARQRALAAEGRQRPTYPTASSADPLPDVAHARSRQRNNRISPPPRP